MSTAAFRASIVLLVLLQAACGGGQDSSSSSTSSSSISSSFTSSSTSIAIDVSQPWISASAAEVGMDEVKLGRAVSDAALIPRYRSLLVARHGRLVSENYFGGAQRSTLFDVRSVTKSVVSLLTGIALQSGKLPGLTATVGQYIGPPYQPDDGDRAVTVQQLLTMTSRYQWDDDADYNPWVLSSDHVQFLLDRPQTNPPGVFVYDSAAVNLLGVMLQTAVGEPLPQYADEVLFRPIGVTSAVWEQLEPTMWNAAAGLQLTAQDMLRIGQLVLQGGKSGDTQRVPLPWVQSSTSPQFTWRDADGQQLHTTYGYLWWLGEPPDTLAFFAWGYGGQYIYIAPTLDLVAVTTADWQGLVAEGLDPVTQAELVIGVVIRDVLPAVNP